MIKITNYKKQYGSGFSIEINQLELSRGIHFLKGKNGSGKSTLMKSIAGLLPYSGQIIFNEINQQQSPNAFKALIGFAEAEPIFPDFLSLQELAPIVMKAKKITSAHYNELLSLFDAEKFHHMPIHSYSSGMLKKAALILALMSKPDLLILDEPFTTIDQETKNILLQQFQNMLGQGKTILYSSHEEIDLEAFDITSKLSFENGKVSQT